MILPEEGCVATNLDTSHFLSQRMLFPSFSQQRDAEASVARRANTFVESEKINGHDPFFRRSNQRRLNCRNDERLLCFDSQLICRRRRRCQMILFLRDVDDDSSTAAGLPNENHYLSPINLNRCLHDKREHELRCGHQKGSKDVWKMVGDMKALQRFRENSS